MNSIDYEDEMNDGKPLVIWEPEDDETEEDDYPELDEDEVEPNDDGDLDRVIKIIESQ